MSDDDLFFVSRNGRVWACWLSGKPAVNLGGEAEVRAAMTQLWGPVPAATSAQRPLPPPPPAPTPHDAAGAVASSPPTPLAPRLATDRSAERHPLTIVGRIFTANGSRDVTIVDLSGSGCQFRDRAGHLKPDARLTIKLGPVGPVVATVRWRRNESVGVLFSTPLYPAVLEHIRDHFDLRKR